MTTHAVAAHAILAFGAVLAAGAATHARAETALKGTLQAIADRRIFFGHQSVGMNLLDGLQELAKAEGVALKVVEASAPGVPPGTIAHAFLEENGAPLKKIAAFSRAFTSGVAAGADVALMKVCYVDITEATDVAALFATYRKTLAEAQAANPGTVFVHVTAPLQTVEDGVRALAKRLLGKPLWGSQHNARREEFNELLRREYAGKAPIFDLAKVEATRPDGGTETSRWQGRDVRTLVPAYSDDGGHLNPEGRRRAARELATVLAAIPRATAATAGAR
jgi:hypothetical protein